MRIPRIFHQIWVGPDPFPDEFKAYQQTWLDHHPDWELKLWTEESLPPASDLRRPEAVERLRAPWERGDIFRLEIIWRMGGVHVDTDFECLRPIDDLLEGVEFFIAVAKKRRVNGAMFGAVPGSPILDDALRTIRPRVAHGASLGRGESNDKTETGPKFLDDVLARHEGVTYVEPKVFFPRTIEERQTAYAVHHRARSWKDAEGLRPELAKFEQRAVEKAEEAREWERRHEEAAAELARLEAA